MLSTRRAIAGALLALLLSSTLAEPCTDRHDDCAGWAELGECANNPAYMKIHCGRSCRHCSDDRCPHRNAAGALVIEDTDHAHVTSCVQRGVRLLTTGARSLGGDLAQAWRLVIPFYSGMMHSRGRRLFPLATRPLPSLWDLVGPPADAGRAPPAGLHVWTAFSPGDDTLYLSMLPARRSFAEHPTHIEYAAFHILHIMAWRSLSLRV